MLVPQTLIAEAKEKFGDQAAIIINDYFKLENFDERNLKGSCPFGSHNDSDPSFIWNSKECCYHCFGCGVNFGIVDLYIAQGMTFLDSIQKLFEDVKIEFRFGEKNLKVRDYKYPVAEQIENLDSILPFWNKRKISEKTLHHVGIGQDSNGNTVFHYYNENDVLCNVKYRPSRKVEKTDKISKFWIQKDTDTQPILLGMNKIDTTKPLFIYEGESDFLTAIECGFYNSVSVPFGAEYKKSTGVDKNSSTWIEHNYEWLEQFPKIIICFDNDVPGTQSRKDVCSRLGTWRTWYIDIPQEVEKDGKKIQVKDINEVLYYCGKEKVIELINNAQETPVANVSDLSLADDFDIENTPGLYSVLGDINKVIYKYIYGSVIVLTGLRGGGKSVFTNQEFICGPLNQGEDVFVFSGEMSKPILKNWVETTMIGKENIVLENGFSRKFNKEKLKIMREWYRGRVWAYDDSDNDSDKILDRAVALTRKHGVKIWVLDNLLTLNIGVVSKDNELQKEKDFMNKLIFLARTYNVLIVLLAHPRKRGNSQYDISRRLTVDDVAGSGGIGNLAQYVMTVHRYTKKEKSGEKNKNGSYIKGKEPIIHDVVIDVLKNRYTGKLDEINFFFDYESYRFYSTSEELSRRYNWNKDNSPLPIYQLPKLELPESFNN